MSEYVQPTPPALLTFRDSVSSELTRSIPDNLEAAEFDSKFQKKNEKKSKRRGRIPIAMGAITLVLSSATVAYQLDVQENKEKSLVSQPQIETIGQPVDPDLFNSSIFYLAGFDTKDGSVYGNKVGTAIHQFVPGRDESINYGDAPLEPVEIAKKIIEHTEAEDLSSISLSGNSLGGIVATKVAEYIVVNSDIEVDAVILNATPDGSSGLLPGTKGDMATMMEVLQNIPDSKYSSFARYAMTMAQESDRFLNEDSLLDGINAFQETSETVIEQVKQQRRPGMWLVVDQALAITNADMEDSLTNIGALRGEKRMPVIVSMRTENPAHDTVVDVEKSSRNICRYARAALLACTIVRVEDATHTSYLFDTDKYSAAIAPRVNYLKQAIEDENRRYELDKYITELTEEE